MSDGKGFSCLRVIGAVAVVLVVAFLLLRGSSRISSSISSTRLTVECECSGLMLHVQMTECLLR